MFGLKYHLIDPMDAPGRQRIALYPVKLIYDTPGFPKVSAVELIENLIQQAAPFAPKYHMGEVVDGLENMGDGRWQLTTSKGTTFNIGAVIIADGFGAFEPKQPSLNRFEIY
jgi:thioredoxin reductase (NADPH)